MNSVFNELAEANRVPTMADISRLLASVDAPGKQQDKKRQTVKELFALTGGGVSPQGHGVWDDVVNYPEF